MKVSRNSLRRLLGSSGGQIDQGMLRYVLDQGLDCIKILSPSGAVEYVNSEGQCTLNISDFSKVCGTYWPDLWPEDSRGTIEEALLVAGEGKKLTIEAARPDSNGQLRWWQISVSPLIQEDGACMGILTISRDITEQVRVREAERTVSLEMKHRLRNAYTVASAIITQSARGNEDQRAFADTLTARLADVALSQARLLEAGRQSWTLTELIKTLVEAHGDGADGVCYAGPITTTVDGHESLLIALVIGELTNNSLKYGALKAGKQLKLTWEEGDGLTLRWCEALDEPLTAPLGARDHGSGYSLMSRMARSQRALFVTEADEQELRVTLHLRATSRLLH